jgi:hypothetical protein
MSFLVGLLPKFLADFLIGWLKDLRRDRALKEAGRTEQELEQEKATVEVISRNAEGQNAVDNMTEDELKDLLTKP